MKYALKITVNNQSLFLPIFDNRPEEKTDSSSVAFYEGENIIVTNGVFEVKFDKNIGKISIFETIYELVPSVEAIKSLTKGAKPLHDPLDDVKGKPASEDFEIKDPLDDIK